MSAEPIRFIIYSDYLCPWCFNASVRLRQIEEEFGDRVELEWRSYLLRPRPNPSRNLDKFRAYTQSWLRPAEEPDAGYFQVWQSDAGPPSHSVPPHLVAKAAARLGRESFHAIHDRLLRAYFSENRDITDGATLQTLWAEAGLPEQDFARSNDPELLEETMRQHQEAIEAGVTGVPSVQKIGNDAVIMGAQPVELYQRWVRRALEGRA